MEPIKFYIGQESGIVVEDKDFDKSLFAEQYKQTFEIFNNIWGSQEKEDFRNASNIIAFCGDRGEGKTSLLTSVHGILNNQVVYDQVVSELQIKISATPQDVEMLDIVDPSFFDINHNLIELVLGQMYGKVEKEIVDDTRCDRTDKGFGKRQPLMRAFQQTKACLAFLEKEKQEQYDEMTELSALGAGVKLRENLNNLFQEYLKYYQKERLVISIDDLDLNIEGGYKMAEEMRKYLCNSPYCIVLVALKVDQLERVIMSSLREKMKINISNVYILDMAKRYVTKLLPIGNRVLMPLGTEIAECKLIIFDRELFPHPYPSVKEAVVRLIYSKTRYIFVNTRSLCPIVPTNLRELCHLVGELWDLPDAKNEDGEDIINNKTIFKQYFYYTWTKCLQGEYLSYVEDILANEDVLSLNKLVASFLFKIPNLANSIKKNIYNKDADIQNPLLLDISLSSNTIYNVSIGDVYYTIQCAERVVIDKNIMNFLFFLKAFYSIKLYDLYNIVSSDEELLFPQKVENTPSIYKYDIQIQQMNQLQRLVKGAYFTYLSGDILPKEKDKTARDKRVIDAQNLRTKFESICKKKYSELSKEERNSYVLDLQLCEFFVLTTTHALLGTEYKSYRQELEPIYLQDYDNSIKWLAFDVLSIFYNLLNVKKTYQRFNQFCSTTPCDFYQLAKDIPESLLNQMLNTCAKPSKESFRKLNQHIHGLISDATIRFSEVTSSIMERLKLHKGVRREGGNANNIRILFSTIQKAEITLYPLEDSEMGYVLPFKFLSPIISFLGLFDEGKNANKNKQKQVQNDFDYIFVGNTKTDEDDSVTDRFLDNAFSIINRELQDIFGKDYRNIAKRFPIKRETILNNVKTQYPSLASYLGNKLEMILTNKKYTTSDDLGLSLLMIYNDIVSWKNIINENK
ncbi:MAG: hypothetical protein MJZ84_06735 [Paludibacteraceae bacterium]|nr:hypothetical protein [Paludibacteraceae bacterium]